MNHVTLLVSAAASADNRPVLHPNTNIYHLGSEAGAGFVPFPTSIGPAQRST